MESAHCCQTTMCGLTDLSVSLGETYSYQNGENLKLKVIAPVND